MWISEIFILLKCTEFNRGRADVRDTFKSENIALTNEIQSIISPSAVMTLIANSMLDRAHLQQNIVLLCFC